MAKLLKINLITFHEGVNEIGDIVAIFEGDHIFTKREIALFDVEAVDESVEEIRNKIPKVENVYRAITTDWSRQEPEEKTVWYDENGVTRDLAVNQKYPLCSVNGSIITTYSRIIANNSRLDII